MKKSKIYNLIRPDAFLFCFGIDLPVSFIPLYAGQLYTPIFGLSKEYVMGLPISVSMLFTTVAFLAGGYWIDRRGWQHTHFWGILLAGCGQILSGTAPSVELYIISRGVYGFGYGLVFMSYMGFVYSNTSDANRTTGFATMSAGMYSGSICGGAIGGMLAERLGFQNVFFIAAFFILITLVYTMAFMKEAYHYPEKKPSGQYGRSHKANLKLILKFVTNRNILSLLVLLSIPAAITLVGVLYYISPVYLDRMGVAQANIARILMINGVFMIYISPMLSPLMDRSKDKRVFIISAGIIGSLGMLSFFFIKGLWAIVFVIFILSLAAAIGHSSRTVFALQQKIAVEIGGGQAMSLYRTIDRIGWVLGPLILSGIVASGNIENGLAMVGGIYLVLTLLFILVSKKEPEPGKT